MTNPVLRIGVIDVPYPDGHATTGEVAEYLENKYHLVELFQEMYEERIEEELAKVFEGELEAVTDETIVGRVLLDKWADKVGHLYQRFLFTGKAERIGIPGTPTKAALKRKRKGERGKSFVETGLLAASVTAWVDYDEPTG